MSMAWLYPIIATGIRYGLPAAMGGLAFALGMGGGALITAPQVAYQQSYAFSQGYGQGMLPGLDAQAAKEREIAERYLAEDLDRWAREQAYKQYINDYLSQKSGTPRAYPGVRW